MPTENLSLSYEKNIIKPDDITKGKVVVKEYDYDHVNNQDSKPRLEWEGEGFFDKLMHSAGENLRIQYDNGRILKPSYGEAYIRLIEVCMNAAIQATTALGQLRLEEALTPLKQEKLRSEIKVLDRQLEGFDDNMYIKLLEAQLNAFSMIYSSGMLDDPVMPDPLNKNELKDIYTTYKRRAEKIRSYKVDQRIVVPESMIEL